MYILLAAQFQTCLVECQGNESRFGFREQILKKRNTVVKESCEEGGRGGKLSKNMYSLSS